MNNRPEELLALLRLSAVSGIGSNRLRSLVGHFRSASRVLSASDDELVALEGIDTKTANNILNCDNLAFAETQLQKLQAVGARLVSFWDEEFPQLLKRIYDPPAFIFVSGKLIPEDKYSVAVVGTRQPSNYGKVVTQKLTLELSQRGITIVSGLAYGVDTIAHANAVNGNGRTTAVLGSGVDRIYPTENLRLARKIAENGAVISEFPMGAGPDRTNFPRRNRIICGLSLGVLVIEAGAKSGALITAYNALEQNREVFAVPGNIDNPRNIGSNELIKQGAKCVTRVEDILEELAGHLKPLMKTPSQTEKPVALSPPEASLISHLSHEPLHIDLLSNQLQQPPAKVLSLLLTLELKNVVKQLPGKMFVKI